MILKGEKGYKWQSMSCYLLICKNYQLYTKDIDKNKEYSHYISTQVLGVKYFTWIGMSKKLPSGGFKWVLETSQFNEDFIKSYNEDNDKEFAS